MKTIAFAALLVQLVAADAHAQTFKDLQIELGAYRQTDDGGEKAAGVWFSSGPVTIGSMHPATFSLGDSCGAFAVSSDGSLTENATMAWRIEATPIRVVRDAVTFRLRWNRVAALKQQLEQISLGADKAARLPGEDIELTLRPGESWPVDAVRVPAGAKTIEGLVCRGNSASIRVLVDHYPSEYWESRVVAADLWLLERFANGGVTTHGQLSVRGLPNRPLPFYFDRVAEAKASLDMFGTLAARLDGGTIALSFDTWSRWGDPKDVTSSPGRSVESHVEVKPGETVEIRLPKFETGPFGGREFAIRVRARQIR
jgi:hypothetical protein